MSRWECPQCGDKYESPWSNLDERLDSGCCIHLLPSDGCDCYKCTETKYDNNGSVKNNMEYHTYGQECGVCGEERTEYKDLGRKGRYVCPNLREHMANGEDR